MVKLLNDKWGIKVGFMTTIHAYTGTQMILDGPRGKKNGRDPARRRRQHHRALHRCRQGHRQGCAGGRWQAAGPRPARPGSGRLRDRAVHRAREGNQRGRDQRRVQEAFEGCEYYGYNADGIVSGDIVGDTHGGVFDPTQTDVNEVDGVQLVRTVAFYDNEYGFTSNMVRTLLYFAELAK